MTAAVRVGAGRGPARGAAPAAQPAPGSPEASAAPVAPVAPAVPVAPAAPAASALRAAGGRLLLGDAPLIQSDPTTCGAASVLAAALLAHRVEAPADPAGFQRRLQRWMNRRSGGPLDRLPWTGRLGSTPWAVARELGRLGAGTATRPARAGSAPHHPDRAYAVRWTRANASSWAHGVARLRDAASAGSPCVLLVGGPPTLTVGGRPTVIGPALPRHYVLVVPPALVGLVDPGEGTVVVYDPSTGAVGALELRGPADLVAGRDLLGGWTHVLALLLPAGTDSDEGSPLP